MRGLVTPSGSPPAPSPLDLIRHGAAELVLLRGAGEPGARYPIPPEGATLGREGDIRFPGDPTLSPFAASFAYRDGLLLVRVEADAAYLRIHGQVRLRPGDEFTIGDHLLRLDAILSPGPTAEGEAIQGSPRPADGLLLRIVEMLPGGRHGRTHLLPPPVRIGRRQGELLLPEDRFVSGRHCALYWDGEQVILEDLQSSNGTFARLAPGVATPLRRGDTLRLGQNILRLR